MGLAQLSALQFAVLLTRYMMSAASYCRPRSDSKIVP
jgi:hypothetical protein